MADLFAPPTADELAAAQQPTAPAAPAASDDLFAPPTKDELAGAASTPDTSHDLIPFAKNVWQGLKNTANEVSTTPLPTMAYNHLVKPAVDTYQAGRDHGKNMADAGLDAAVKGTGDVASLGKSVVTPEMMPFEAYFRSKKEGNSTDDALKDARNIALLVGAPKAMGMAGKAALGGLADSVGIDAGTRAAYRADPAGVNASASMPAELSAPEPIAPVVDPQPLQDAVGQDVTATNDAVSGAKANVTSARDNLQASKDANRANVQASKDSAEAARATATQQAKESMANLAPDITDHLDESGAKLRDMSNQALDILHSEGKTFDPAELQKVIADKQGELSIDGVAPKQGPHKAAYDALGSLHDTVGEIGEANPDGIPAASVKKIIQQIDASTAPSYDRNAGVMDPAAASKLKSVRYALNDALRGSPDSAYAKQMDALSPQVNLTKSMSKPFGTEANASRALRAMSDPANPQGMIYRKILDQYDAANNTTFGKQLDATNPAAELPEEQALNQARQDAAQSLQSGRAGVKAAQMDADSAKAWQEPLAPLQPNQIGNTLDRARAGDPQAIELLKHLDELNGTNHAKVAAAQGQANAATDAANAELQANHQEAQTQHTANQATANAFSNPVPGNALKGALATGAAGLGYKVGGPVMAGLAGGVGLGTANMVAKYGAKAVKMALDAGIAVDKLGPYTPAIMNAAARGPAALQAAQYMMQQDMNQKKTGP